ncbi:MAG: response regulator, partial [Xanthomonadales bacterium]|nr:response regulator [Xanthomonadales bacterium]
MFQFFDSLFDQSGFMAHGYCILWQPPLVLTYIISDAVIALSYFTIPFALGRVVMKRKDIRFSGLVLMFAAFIFSCGVTHIFGIITLWYPVYWLDGLAKAGTAAISLATAISLWQILPAALKIPSQAQMDAVNAQLRDEVDVRTASEEALRESQEKVLKLNAELEARVEERTAELQRREEELRAILNTVVDGIVTIDADGVIQSFNPAAERIFGCPSEAIVGDNISSLMPEPFSSNHADYLLRFRQTREARVIGVGRELVGLKRDGQTFPMELAVSEMRVGGAQMFTGIVRDITQRKLSESLILQAKAQAEEASRAKSEFVANMSHEIRTPMNAILGMMQLLRSTELQLRQRDYVGKANAAAQTMLGILNDILDVSKIEAGKMTLDPHPFDLDEMLENTGVVLGASVGNKDVEVLFDVDPSLPAVICADSLRLQQVIINLAGNAIKFTPSGEIVVGVRRLSGSHDPGERLQISVRDTGVGIEPEHLRRIFESFMQAETSTTRRYGGTGLGLAICQRLVQLMGGELAVQSEPGVGSEFSFSIPFEDPSATLVPESPSKLDKRLRLLIVEGNATGRQILSKQVAGQGWRSDTAPSARQGLELIQSSGQRFDLILLDRSSVDRDGEHFHSVLRKLPGYQSVPLLIMSTPAGRESLIRAEGDELADGFVLKPITAGVLRRAAEQAYAAGHREGADGNKRRERGLALQGVSVLLAEDNLTNQQVAKELLEAQGAMVMVAEHGAAAVEMALHEHFDVILMDVQMPEMDGYMATAEIRQRETRRHPIIAITANAMDSAREQALEAGMDDHLAKPFDIRSLVDAIKRQIDHSEDTGPARYSVRQTTAQRTPAEDYDTVLD